MQCKRYIYQGRSELCGIFKLIVFNLIDFRDHQYCCWSCQWTQFQDYHSSHVRTQWSSLYLDQGLGKIISQVQSQSRQWLGHNSRQEVRARQVKQDVVRSEGEVRFHNDKPCLIITNRFLDDMRIISPANSYINIRGHWTPAITLWTLSTLNTHKLLYFICSCFKLDSSLLSWHQSPPTIIFIKESFLS